MVQYGNAIIWKSGEREEGGGLHARCTLHICVSIFRIFAFFRYGFIQSKIALCRADTSQRGIAIPCKWAVYDRSYPLQTYGGFPLAPRRLVKYWRLLIRKPTKLRGNGGEEASGEEESDAESPRCVKTLKCNKSRRIASSSKHANKRVWKPSEKCYSVNQPANYVRLCSFMSALSLRTPQL